MTEKETRRISKFLSLVLRHQPGLIGLELDGQGWTDVEELMKKARKKKMHIDRETLEFVVANNNKKRFAFNEDKSKIRASQGHSIDVNLGYQPTEPPEFLYHGTVPKFLDVILNGGIKKMSRHDVHLSADTETAVNVGNRRGKAIILTILAGEMHKNGYEFFVSANGVWLTDHVPPEFIRLPE